MNNTRKKWIDNLRGVCMLAILLDHTEIYYTGDNIISYSMYVANALVMFFIISGYLMYKTSPFDIKHKLHSIFKSLFIPYLFFTSIIAIPKTLAHNDSVDLLEIAKSIILGDASWFITALCLSEFLFAMIIWITKGKNSRILFASIITFGISIILSKINKQPYFWQLDNALQAILFLSMGYFYHQHESIFQVYRKKYISLILLLVLIIIKLVEYQQEDLLLIHRIHITNYPLFLADISISSLFLIQTFKGIPSIRWINWVGRHSIVYYFLCGGVPLFVGIAFNKMGLSYQGNYLLVMLAFFIVCILTTIFTYCIYRCFPFIVKEE